MKKIDPEDRLAPRQPRSMWGLCGHCIEETRVRKRKLIDGRVVLVCDHCFNGGAIILDMCFPEAPIEQYYADAHVDMINISLEETP